MTMIWGTSGRVNSTVGSAIVFWQAILIGSLNWAVCQLGGLLDAGVNVALGALPSIVLTSWHALQPSVSIDQALVEGFFRVLTSSWSAILSLAGAA